MNALLRSLLTLRHVVEYLGMRGFLFVLDRLPLGLTERVVTALADGWYLLNGARRRTAQDNIRQAGIATDPREVSRIARASFRHFGILIAESLKSDLYLGPDTWRDHVDVDIPPATMAVLTEPGHGVILVSGHLGNWEIAAQLLSFLKPVVGITKNMNNPYTDRLMKARKPRNRFRLTPKRDAGSVRLLAALKGGEILALLVDQHARQALAMPIEFFGRPVSMHKSAALLHLVTGAPLCFGYCLRTGRMRYTLKALEPIVHKPTGNKAQDIRLILERLNAELETAIRSAPEQYLWAHRRWRDRSGDLATHA